MRNMEWLSDDRVRHIDPYGIIYYYKPKEKNDRYILVLHCEDGPAKIFNDKTALYALDNQVYNFDEWCLVTNKSDEEKMLLKLQYECF